MFTLQYRGFQSLTVVTHSKIRGKDLDFERDFSQQYFFNKAWSINCQKQQTPKVRRFSNFISTRHTKHPSSGEWKKMKLSLFKLGALIAPQEFLYIHKTTQKEPYPHRFKCRICQKYFSDYYRVYIYLFSTLRLRNPVGVSHIFRNF